MGFSLLSLIFYCVENNLVDQLLDGSAIIGEIDGTGMLFAYIAIGDARLCYALKQRIVQIGGIDHKIGERGWRVGTYYQAVSEAFRINDIHIGKDRMHGLRQCLYQPEIMTRASRVNHRHTSWRKMLAHLLEELLCSELERHIGLLVGINAHHIILLRG